MLKKKTFTLAEVLITLVIIGVVAALTIPTLVAKINDKVSTNRREVIEKRLLDGINRYSALEDGLSQHYDTTYDFLVGLSKHYKMSQICKADEITNCIPYDVINYTVDGEDATVDVSTLTTTSALITGNPDDYLEPASFITAQGTPFIMAFKKDCVWDMGKAMRNITDSGCIAYMYDENGTQRLNKLGKDIVNQGMTIVVQAPEEPSSGGETVAAEIATVGGIKIMEKAFFPNTGLTSEQCSEEIAKNYGITQCSLEDDRWAYAMKYCNDKGWHLPNEQESLAIVNGLFKDTSGNHPSGNLWDSNNYKIDLDQVSVLGLKNQDRSNITQSNIDVNLWSSVEQDWNTSNAYIRFFNIAGAGWGKYSRDIQTRQVLCIK